MYLAIIPAFNEDKSIVTIVKETKKYVDRVIVVDDSSWDKTQELARRSGAIVLRHLKNRGVGAAMITGLKYARKLKPEIVVTLDADGQHKPEDIPRIMHPIIVDKADWVLGSRFLKGLPADTSPIKYIGNEIFTFLTSLLAGVRLTDTQTGFRALNGRALLALELVSEFTYTQEMILDLTCKGYRVVEVPIQVRPRKQGNSKVASNFVEYGFKSLVIILSTYLRQKLMGEKN